jgi:hypothetical protein
LLGQLERDDARGDLGAAIGQGLGEFFILLVQARAQDFTLQLQRASECVGVLWAWTARGCMADLEMISLRLGLGKAGDHVVMSSHQLLRLALRLLPHL